MIFKRRNLTHDWLDDDTALTTGRVTLLPLSEKLDSSYLSLLDEEFLETHRWTNKQLKLTRRYLESRPSRRHKLTRGLAVMFPSGDLSDVVGFVDAKETIWPGFGRVRLIGIQIAPAHQGCGYATEVLPVLFKRLSERKLEKVFLCTGDDNIAMTRVCEKLGLEYEVGEYNHPDGSSDQARIYPIAT